MARRILAVIDRDGAATAEQYTDLLAFCLGMRASFGDLDLVLRGRAVECALVAGDQPEPQRHLRTLLRTGVRVWADGADLMSAGRPLLDGVVAADTNAMAVTWLEYEKVWFL